MQSLRQTEIKNFFNNTASTRDSWKARNSYYHRWMENIFKYLVPKDSRVLEIGCSTGDLLAALQPKYALGIDLAEKVIEKAKKKHKKINFKTAAAEDLNIKEKFDYIILMDLIGNLEDVQTAFSNLSKVSTNQSRIIITYYNFLWEPVLNLAQKLGLMMPQPTQNWLSDWDIENLIFLSDLEVIKKGYELLLPLNIPILSNFVNKYLARLPLLRLLTLSRYFIVRKKPSDSKDYTVSIIIPARNEAGNIEAAVKRTPNLGKLTEIIFVEGNSSDNTLEEIKRVINKYKDKRELVLIEQGKGVGKGDAVRKGFTRAKGDILMILDADLTMPPEQLPKIYSVIKSGKGEFVMGSRLVYPMEKQAMRLLNIIGNKFFGLAFSWLLDQPIKDTLCGTKVLSRKNYQKIADNRSYFGDFDPFGDFDLIFGASKLNLKMAEIPIRYAARTYGSTNISRFKHGLLLLKMTIFATKKIKFI